MTKRVGDVESGPWGPGVTNRAARFLDWARTMPYWGVSAVIHAVVALLAMQILWSDAHEPSAERSFVLAVTASRPPMSVPSRPLPSDTEDRPEIPQVARETRRYIQRR